MQADEVKAILARAGVVSVVSVLGLLARELAVYLAWRSEARSAAASLILGGADPEFEAPRASSFSGVQLWALWLVLLAVVSLVATPAGERRLRRAVDVALATFLGVHVGLVLSGGIAFTYAGAPLRVDSLFDGREAPMLAATLVVMLVAAFAAAVALFLGPRLHTD
jgi:hypothetical protein